MVHVVPEGCGTRRHTAERECWCGPVVMGHTITGAAAVVVRHRPPPDPRLREDPGLHREPIPEDLPVPLQRALAAARAGAREPAELADRLRVHETTARAMLTALRELGEL